MRTFRLFTSGLAMLATTTYAQVPDVLFAANESSKQITVTRAQLETNSPSVRVRSAPVARVCKVPTGAAAARFVVNRHPEAAQAAPVFTRLRTLDIADDGRIIAGTLPGPQEINATLTLLLPAGISYSLDPAVQAMQSNFSESTIPIDSSCLTVLEFRAWKNELIRVLTAYYGNVVGNSGVPAGGR